MTETTFTPELAAIVRELADRQAIMDCLLRYTRGGDRHDHNARVAFGHPVQRFGPRGQNFRVWRHALPRQHIERGQ